MLSHTEMITNPVKESLECRLNTMEEQRASAVTRTLLAIDKVKEQVDELRMFLREMQTKSCQITQPIRQNLTPLVLAISTESEEGISTELRWKHQSISTLSKVIVGKLQDDTKPEITFCDLKCFEHSGPLAVCKNDSVDFTSTFVTKMTFVGSWSPSQPFKIVPICVKPPAKPPDKSINMLQMLDSHMIPKLLSISHKSDDLNTWISRLQTKVFSVTFSSVFASLKSEVVREAMESRLWSSDQYFPSYLRLCISTIYDNAPQIFFVSSGMRWHFVAYYIILCQWNDVQIILSWFGKPIWLPTDVTSYIILWHGLFMFTEADKFVKCSDIAGFVIILKNGELILCGFAHKVRGRQSTLYLCASSSFVVLLIMLAAVTLYLNLNLICKHVIDHVMWFNGAHEDEVHVQEVLVPCSGALLVPMIAKKMFSERVVAAALCRVLVNVLHYCRYLLKRHIDLILKDYLLSNKHQDMVLTAMDFEKSFFIEDGLIIAGFVGDFEAGSTKLDQPMIMVWSGEVIFKVKGFAKFLFCKEQAKLKHDIIIIRIDTEGTSPSNFSFTFGIAWADKRTCHFSCRVILRVQTCLTHDSEAVKLYLERNGLKRHYNSVMRCLSGSISFISSGCYIDPLMLKAKSTWMVDWYFQIKGTIEFMVTLQRIEKDGQIFGTHGLQILCFSDHQKSYDLFPDRISNCVAFFSSHWTTFFSQIYATMNWMLDKMEGTQIYEKNLQHHILSGSLGSENQTDYEGDAISLKFIYAASYDVMVAAVVVNEEILGSSTTSQLTQCYVTQIPSCHLSSGLQHGDNVLGAYLATLTYGSHLDVYCARMRENARCISLENHVMQQKFGSNDQQPLLGATGMSQFSHAPSYVAKVEPLAQACDPVVFAKLEIVTGLTYLETRKQELVASRALQMGIGRGNNYYELMAPRDVATYVQLYALGSFDQTKLKNKVINNSNFKSFLEFVNEVRELINDFHSSHYTSRLGNFGDNKSNLLLDINEHPPVAATWKMSIQHEFLTFDLEGKVAFERGSNVTDY